MYYEHFGLTEPPFRITPHTEFFFAGANRGATLDALIYAIISDECIVKLSGEVGSGKTMLCRVLMERLPPHVAIVYLANPSLSKEDIVFAIAEELGLAVSETARASTVIRALQTRLIELHGAGKQVVVLIDEAHAMPPESLEEIRLLSNLESGHHKLLQMVLFGQPELDVTLAQMSMRQLRERIVHGFELEPLRRNDIGQYLLFRMRAAGYKGPDNFSPAAIRLLSDASEGLTRRINILADKALLAAFADNAYQVESGHVQRAIDDSQFVVRNHTLRKAGWLAAAALACLAVGWLGGLWMATRYRLPAAAPVTVAAASVAKPSAVAPVAKSQAQEPIKPVPVMPQAEPKASNSPEDRWLSEAPPGHFTIQLLLASASTPAALDAFIEEASRLVARDELHVYRSLRQGNEYVGVVYGRYADRKAAREAMAALPASLQVNRPIFRTFAGIRQEIQSR